MTSPIALRRTIKMRCACFTSGSPTPASPWSLTSANSGSVSATDSISRKTDSLLRNAIVNDFSGGMILGITDNFDPAPAFLHHIPLGNGFRRIVGALRVNVRPDFADQCPDIRFVKDDNRIHVGDRSKNFGSLLCRHSWTTGSFQRTYSRVTIHRHDNTSAQLLGCMKIPNVADVQYIKAPVRQNDFFAFSTPLAGTLPQPSPAENLCIGLTAQWLTAAEDFSSACKSSCCVTVAVPRFITTMPPA